MANGANEVHKYLKSELENYIKSQYFGKSPLLLSTVAGKLDDEGELYQQPYIESSPAYVSVPNGIDNADIPEWMRTFFKKLADANNRPEKGANRYEEYEENPVPAAGSADDRFPAGRLRQEGR